ncbi:MAG: DinB family protein [Pyrinomonadaceae bacterium]
MDTNDIRQLFDFNAWANRLVLDAAARLSAEAFTRDLKNSFPSVRDTLAHLLFAEWVWLRRWKGESPRAAPWQAEDFANVERLRAALAEVESERAELLTTVTDDALAEWLTYTNVRGEQWRYPLGNMMQHVVNHSTYHRGQVITMLRQLGAKEVPSTDFLYYFEELLPETRVGTKGACDKKTVARSLKFAIVPPTH